MMHPEAVKALEPFAALEPVTAAGFDVQARREEALGWARNETRPDIEYVVDVDAHGVPCRLFRPFEDAPLIVYAHGGGFVFGEIETHDAHARRLAETSGSAVLLVDYRRAPEARYPAASRRPRHRGRMGTRGCCQVRCRRRFAVNGRRQCRRPAVVAGSAAKPRCLQLSRLGVPGG